MDMLPPGVLQHTFDITIQAPGGATFTTPAELTMPNVFGSAPGTKLDILSFDHTTGRLVIDGTGTVSADGQTVTSDPGTGVTAPGWHGLTPPGDCGMSGGPPPPPPAPTPKDTREEHDTVVEPMMYGESGSFSLSWSAPAILPDTPPAPPVDNSSCPAPPRPADPPNEKQPFLEVTIDVDGPLAEFMKQAGGLPLISQTFRLEAGSGETKTFDAVAKSYDELFPGGLSSVDQDILYGSEIKVTQVTGKADGSTDTTVDTYDLYRFVNATEPIQDPNENTIDFGQVLVGTDHEHDFEVKASKKSAPKVSGTPYGAFQSTVLGNKIELRFDPGSTGSSDGRIILTNNNGVEIPNSLVYVEKSISDQIFINLNSGVNSLQQILTARTSFGIKDINSNLYSKANLPKLEGDIAAKVAALYQPFEIRIVSNDTEKGTATVKFGRIPGSSAFGTSDNVKNIDREWQGIWTILKTVPSKKISLSAKVASLAKAIHPTPLHGFVLVSPSTVLDYYNKLGKHLSEDELATLLADVAAHEIGHALDLVHNTILSDIMIRGDLITPEQSLQAKNFLTGQTKEPLVLASGSLFTLFEGLAAFRYYQRNIVALGFGRAEGPGQLQLTIPSVTSVRPSQTGTVNNGQAVQFTIALSERVTVDTANGSPTLALSNGATASYDANASNPSAGTLTFDYAVGPNDTTTDLRVLGFDANGATVRGSTGSDADLSGLVSVRRVLESYESDVI